MHDQYFLDILVNKILEEHNYGYRTFCEAESTIEVSGTTIKYHYDRLSLCVYSHTLNSDEFGYVGRKLSDFFNDPINRDNDKTRSEYVTLFKLCQIKEEYLNYEIEKTLRPDFILTNDQKIGVEVTELVIPTNKKASKIIQHTLGEKLLPEELHNIARKEHGKMADTYSYFDIKGTTAIMPKVQNFSNNIAKYADEILRKYRKYCDIFSHYDKFIILCDATNVFEIVGSNDTKAIIELVKMELTNATGFTVFILFTDDVGKSQLDAFEF